MTARSPIARWMAITAIVSVIGWLDGGLVWRWLTLAPGRVWHGEVWRVVTWIFVEPSPSSLVFTLLVIYRFGGELLPRWGARRLVRFLAEVLLLAALVTCALAWVSDTVWTSARDGGWAVCDVLVIAWARQYPYAPFSLYGMITIRGKELVTFTVGFVVLCAVAWGPLAVIPELVAVAAAALYPRARLGTFVG